MDYLRDWYEEADIELDDARHMLFNMGLSGLETFEIITLETNVFLALNLLENHPDVIRKQVLGELNRQMPRAWQGVLK